MFTLLSDIFRLLRAAFALARRDALIPREYAHFLPLPLRVIGMISRIGAHTKQDGRTLRSGERLASAFENLGPFYVKTGQFMATRPDIIGFAMACDLGRLQDRMPPFSRQEAIKEIELAFNQPLEELFTDFSEPIAAASIAQAHKAVLKSGEIVAVKILRPNIEKRAQKDFRALMRAAKVVEFFSKAAQRMEPVKFIQTLKQAAILELDLRLEAGATSEMADNLRHDSKIRIPNIIWAKSGKRVLTTEWISGTPLGDMEEINARGVNRPELAKKILQSFLEQALHLGFFHADMHQGNMIIDEDERLALIDFGIMGRLDDMARRTFAQIIYGFINRDYQQTAQAHFDAGYIDSHYNVDAFAQALRAVGEPLYGQNADQMDMSRVLQQLFEVTEMFDMHLRPELVLLQRTMVTVEGVARMLDPEINMWETATPIVRQYITDRLGPKHHLKQFELATRKAIEIAPQLPTYVEDIAIAAKAMVKNDMHINGADPKSNHDKKTGRNNSNTNHGTRPNNSALIFVGCSFLALAAVLALKL